MYDQIREDPLYIMLYAVVTALAILASCYLLFGRANVIAPDIKPPMRLRRWTAAFFASFALNHLWYMPILFDISSEDVAMIDLTGGLLDCLTIIPLVIVVLFAMLQDRQRPLWIVAAMMAPLVVGMVWSIAYRSYALQPIGYVYFLIMCIGLSIYMVRAVRQYGKWLRNNYADLEHKEVWVSHMLVIIILIIIIIDGFEYLNITVCCFVQLIEMVFVGLLLWRVETLPQLESTPAEQRTLKQEQSMVIPSNIEQLLTEHCVNTKLYLKHDLTLLQLAQAIGTNRLYLSQYFSRQGITYNAYINDLRISYFMSLYHEKTAAGQPIVAQQLASASGYRSYSTFSLAFKQRTGQSVTAWLHSQSTD